jgi:GNAT superfamily N-acetyltransferase
MVVPDALVHLMQQARERSGGAGAPGGELRGKWRTMDAALDTVFLYSIEPQVKHAWRAIVEASPCRSTAKLSCGLPTTKPGQALHVTRRHERVQISVSPAGFSDWPQLLGLLRESFAYMDSRIDPPSSLARMGVDELKAKAAGETLIIATEGPNLIGCAFADLRDECVYVGKVAVAQSARGKGVARAMFAAAEVLARRHGRKFLELQTRIELVENHDAFGALGFEKVAETAHPNYNRPTSITMRKRVAECTA